MSKTGRNSKQLGSPAQPRTNQQKTKPAQARYQRRRTKRQRMRRAPAAFSYITSSYANISIVRGEPRLNIREIFHIDTVTKGLSAAIPVSPTKWRGTRAASLAANYTSFRPLSCRIQWHPAVGTSQEGNIAIGTIFDGARLPSGDWTGLSQSLTASNGGFMVTMWQPATTTIKLGTCLRDNLYPTYQINEDEIPFWVVAAGSVAKQSAGYIIINLSMSLKNPINGIADPPTTYTGPTEFVHDDETKTTVMKIDNQLLNKTLNIGTDYSFVLRDILRGTQGQAIANILSPIIATVKEIVEGRTVFAVDSNVATQTMTGTLVGLCRNFI